MKRYASGGFKKLIILGTAISMIPVYYIFKFFGLVFLGRNSKQEQARNIASENVPPLKISNNLIDLMVYFTRLILIPIDMFFFIPRKLMRRK